MTTQKEIKNLRQAIEKVMTDFPPARDSDQWLTIKLWTIYFPSRIHEHYEMENGVKVGPPKKYVFLQDIMDLPREDNVKRLRAKIQNEEGKLLPTKWEIAKKRNINESVWRNYINYN